MGSFISLDKNISSTFKYYLNWELSKVRLLFKKFEKLQKSFGWGIDKSLFIKLFDFDNNNGNIHFNLWDTDKNLKTDILEIFSVLYLCSKATFSEKIDATFELYDFDDSNSISKDELVILLKTSIRGLAKITNANSEKEDLLNLTLESLAKGIFDSACLTTKNQINKKSWFKWASESPSAATLYCSYGTKDAAAYMKKFENSSTSNSLFEIQAKAEAVILSKAASAIQRQFRKFKSENYSDNVVGTSFSSSQTASSQARSRKNKAKYSMNEIVSLKRIFDEMDKDNSGKISVRELAQSFDKIEFKNVVSVFGSIDSDNSGSISFEELLIASYPLATTAEHTIMLSWAYPLNVKDDELSIFYDLFKKADIDCCGQVLFFEYLRIIDIHFSDPKYSEQSYKYIRDAINSAYSLPRMELNSKRDIVSSLTMFFSPVLGANILKTLIPRIRIPYFLSEEQHKMLDTTFSVYLRKELKERYDQILDFKGILELSKSGFKEVCFEYLQEDDIKYVFNKFDVDHSNNITRREFKRIFRNVWEPKN